MGVNEILTVKEAATFLKKHPDTIRHWILAQKLPAKRIPIGKNGIFVLLRTDVLEVMVRKSVEKKVRKNPVKRRDFDDTPQIKLPME